MEKKKPQNSALDARKAAAFCLRQVMVQKRPIDGFFAKDPLFLSLSDQDKAFCQRLIRSCLRHYGAIENSFKPYFKRPIAQDKFIVLAHIYLAATQIAFEKIPSYAAINSAVELVKKDARAFEKLTNAVLRGWLREHAESKVEGRSFKENPNHNIPQWLAKKWLENYGDDFQAIAECLAEEPALDLTFKSVEASGRFLNALGEEAAILGKTVRVFKQTAVTSLPEYEDGNWWVQDLAATLPVYLFGDIRGKKALDMCAAPGGKTMQLASMGADVDALDSHDKRLKTVEENLKRVGLNANLHVIDAMKWQAGGAYDLVLLDAPCSATGTLRRNPDIKYIRTPKNLLGNTQNQEKLLRKGLELLKPGGKLVYCVCSMEMEEGEDVIEALLNEDKNVILANNPELLPVSLLESGGLGFRSHPGLFAGEGGIDGFFMTCLEKK